MPSIDKSGVYPRLLVFFALAFAWSWICWLLSSLLRPQLPILGMVLFIAGSFGPGIAAIPVVRYASGQDGLHRWLRRSLQWRVGWRWLALSFFLPLAVMVMPDGSNLRPYGLAVGLLVLIALGLLCDAKPDLPRRSPKP